MGWQFFSGAVLGAVLGVVAAVVLQPSLERMKALLLARTRRRLARRVPPSALDADLACEPVQALVWSGSRPLDPRFHAVRVDQTPAAPQDWFPPEVWQVAAARYEADISGVVCGPTSYTVDSREGGSASYRFDLAIRSSEYAHSLAVQALCDDDEHWLPLGPRLRTDYRAALQTAPPQSIFVALTVSVKNGYALAMHRSGAVATARGRWSLAACETMSAIPKNPGQTPETLFDVAYRAAYEELGLERHELGDIWFSWFGFVRPDGPVAIAHVLCLLAPELVETRLRNAEGSYEADRWRWVHAGQELRSLAADDASGTWVRFNPLVARELARMQDHLGRDPRQF